LEPFLLKFFSLDATFKSVGDVNNVYVSKKIAVLVGRTIGGGGGLKKAAKFTFFFMNSFKIDCIFIILL
jgi:hypothetical protein